MLQQVLVDTSAWIEALRRDGDPEIRSRVRSATAEGRAVFCDLVRLELWNGAEGKAEKKLLRNLESNLDCLPTTPEVWERAREIARRCRAQGVTVPATDLLITACARQHGVTLIQHDSHFKRISKCLQDD